LVDLDAVEARIAELPDVARSVAVMLPRQRGRKQVAVAMELAPGNVVDHQKLKADVTTRLMPGCSRARLFVAVGDLPTDRDAVRSALLQPRTKPARRRWTPARVAMVTGVWIGLGLWVWRSFDVWTTAVAPVSAPDVTNGQEQLRVLARDHFDRGNGFIGTPDVGLPWTVPFLDYAVDGGMAVLKTDPARNLRSSAIINLLAPFREFSVDAVDAPTGSGVVFRMVDERQFFFVSADSAAGVWRVSAVRNGIPFDFGVAGSLRASGATRIRVVNRADRFSVEVDNELVVFPTREFADGRFVGLTVAPGIDRPARWDNLDVSGVQ
jgi:hypothetical protein